MFSKTCGEIWYNEVMAERLSLVDYASRVSEESVRTENERRTVEIASILINNPGYVGGKMEDDESQVVSQNILGIFKANYDSVDQMERIAKGIIPNGTDRQTKLAKENLKILGDAGVVALNYLYRGYQNGSLPLDGQEAASLDPLFVNTKLDGVGKFIVTRNAFFVDNEDRNSFSKLIRTVDGNRGVFIRLLDAKNEDGEYTKLLKRTIATLPLFSRYIDSTGAVVGNGLLETERDTNTDEDEIDYNLVRESMMNPENRESPYTITEDYFVKMIFDYESPRLFPQTPGKWFKRLSETEQYKIQIQQRLAEGVGYKLGTKDISPEKARENKIYNFPTKELKLIYEMYGVQEAMQTFVQDLFEFYTEDGKRFLRLKQCKAEDMSKIPLTDNQKNEGKTHADLYVVDGDGYVRRKKDEQFVIDPLTNIRLGNSVFEDCSFENYREAMFYSMAMKKKVPGMDEEYYRNNWQSWKDVGVKKSILEYREKNKRNKGGDLTDAEIEYKWLVDNCLEEKRAVATAWNFLFVGNIIESADIYRQLKPTQVNSDKIRTMMMPLEKFLQKIGIYEDELTGMEESYGGNLALWVQKRFLEEESEGRHDLRGKIRYAATHDRKEMTEDQWMWRMMPKRVMCSFVDNYRVKTDSGREMRMSEALMNGEKIQFRANDLDVFVDTRDTWDEVQTVMMPLIGKGKVDIEKQIEEFTSMVVKLQGVVNSIGKNDKVYDLFTRNPEYYAWLVANTVGLEINMDIPILKRSSLKRGQHYFVSVEEIADALKLDDDQTRIFCKILNAEGWWSSKGAINHAEQRRNKRFRERGR